MQLHQETGRKQHILAENTFGNDIIPSLSNLFIASYEDCTVLAVFSCLEKKLLGYKITKPGEPLKEIEQWMHEDFNLINHVSFSHLFEITPRTFSNTEYPSINNVNDKIIAYKEDNSSNTIHYSSAIISHHLVKKTGQHIYLYREGGFYIIVLLNGETCILANSFECENETEVLYFLLNALHISDILPSDTTLNLDYSILSDLPLVKFIEPHFIKTELLRYPLEEVNPAIPLLPEKLFACYAASLCV